MIILGIDTATEQVGVAVGGVEGVLAEFRVARGRRHAETLAPAVQFVCAQAGIELSQVSVVAVDIGPGLFTGLRVGLSTAKAMAAALRVPMVGLPSLDLLAFPLRHTSRTVVAAIDARRNEVFTTTYRAVPGGLQRSQPYRLCTPSDLLSELQATDDEYLLAGDGALRYADAFAGDSRIELASVGHAYPSAAALVELSQPRALREDFVQPWEIEALYLRKADAEINWERRHPEGSGLLTRDA